MALREELALDVQAAERSIQRLERQLTDAATGFSTGIEQALSRIRDVTLSVDVDTSALRSVGREVQTEIGSIDADVEVTADTAQATDSIRRFGTEVEEASSRVSNLQLALLAVGAAATIAFGVQLVRVGVEYNTLVQRALAAFTTVTGSLEGGRAVLAEITEFARSSPFPRQAFIEATQTMLAFGFAAEEIVPTLSAIQDGVAAIGGTTQDLTEVVRVFSQIRSTGRITAENLNQLGIRGINAAEIIGDAFGQTAGEIRDSISAGTIDAGEAIDALVDGMEDRFSGAAEGLRSTWFGALDRIRGALRDIGSLLVSPFIDPTGGGIAVDLANELADALRRLEATLGPLVESLSQTLGPELGELGSVLIPLLVDSIAALLPLLTVFAELTGNLLPILTAVSQIVGAIPSELLGLAGAFLAVNSAITLANRSLQLLGVSGGLAAIGRNAGAAALGLRSAATAGTGFVAGLRGMVAGINPVVAAVGAGAGAFALWSNMLNNARAEGETFASSIRESMAEPAATIQELEDRIAGLKRGLALAQESGGIRGLTIDRDYNEAIRAARTGLEELEAEQVATRDSALALASALGITGDEALELLQAWEALSDRPILEAQQPAVQALRAEQDELIEQYGEMLALLEQMNEIGIGGFQREVLVTQLEAMGDRIAGIGHEILDLERGAVAAADALAAVGLSEAQLAGFETLTGRFLDLNTGIETLGQTVPDLAFRLITLRSGLVDSDQALLGIALSIRDADLSAEEFASTAAALGVTVDELKGFVEGATGALDAFVSAAAARLPTAGTVFGIARQEAQRFTATAGGSGSAVRNASRQIDQYVSKLQDAQDELLKALQPPRESDLFRAETARERALFRQEEAVKAVAEAERLLRRVDRDAATERTTRAKLQEEREAKLRDARLRLAEATFALEDSEESLAEVQARGTEQDPAVVRAREQVADATERLSDAQTSAAESARGSGRSSREQARDVQVSAGQLTRAFEEQAKGLDTFRGDLEALNDAGFNELAAMLAEEGPEVAGAVAGELRRALEAGNVELVQGLDDAREAFENAGNETLDFYRNVLGPEMILEAGIVGSLSAGAFGEGYDLLTQIEIASRLAATGLDREGQAIALIAASEGEEAARAYGALFDIDQQVVDAAVEAGERLGDDLPGDPFGTAGRKQGGDYISGLVTGIAGQVREAEEEARNAAARIVDATRRALKIKSPSRVAADEIGLPFVQGIMAGIEAGAREIDATVVGLGSRMVSGAQAGAVQNIDQSRHISAPIQVVGASDPGSTATRTVNRLRARASML